VTAVRLATTLWARWQVTRAGQAWTRYGRARGSVLAAGIAYAGFFSLFPAVAVAYTTLGLIADRSIDLRGRLVTAVNSIVGSEVIGPHGIVTVDQLIQPGVLTSFGVVGLLVLLIGGLGWVAALRQGIRAMFGLDGGGNPVVVKLLDLMALGLAGGAVLASMAGTVALALADGTGWSGFAVQVVVDLGLILLDSLIFLALFRWLAGVPGRGAELYPACLTAALALFLLKIAGSQLLRLASGNRLLAGASLVVGLLVWLNVIGRVTLLAAAWAATRSGAPLPTDADVAGVAAVPAPVARDALAAAGFDLPPGVAARSQDQVVLVAGAILGATALIALGVGRRAMASAFALLRRS
jgi:membrane protein